MAEIVQFVSRAQAEARDNLRAFIDLAQHQLTAFSGGGAWETLTWRLAKLSVVFCKYRSRTEARHEAVPLGEPFLFFAKAYVRYQYSHQPVQSMARMISALRLVEMALIQCGGGRNPDILDLNGAVLDLAARRCSELLTSAGSQYQVGQQIEWLTDFCREHRLVTGLVPWKSPFPRSDDLTEALTEDGRRHREAKMPSNAAMLALADLFSRANDTENEYFTAIMALMMVAPSRISEVLALPVDCVGWEVDSKGVDQMYLRWFAAKGGGVMKKWVPTVMQSVVTEAVARLTRIGAPARAAARFAFEHPDSFMRHAGCLTEADFGADEPLTPAQVAAAIGVKHSGRGGWGELPSTWKKIARSGPITYRTLAAIARDSYCGHYWPYADKNKQVLMWDALCLAREFEYHGDFGVRPFSWGIVGCGEVNVRLGDCEDRSLFKRAGLALPDGSPVALTTHQLRHWLSTMSLRAGMDDYTLAQWAGRTKINDNRHYDHRTDQERGEVLKKLLRSEKPALLERVQMRLPVTYQELGVDRLGTAKATLYGMCVHDYAMAPCMKHRDCITCKEHVCIKGDVASLERMKQLEASTAVLLEKARQADSDGVFGASRWVDHHGLTLAHVRTMLKLMESESVPDGTSFRVPSEYDPSPTRRALMDRKLIPQPTRSDMPIRLFPPAVTELKGA